MVQNISTHVFTPTKYRLTLHTNRQLKQQFDFGFTYLSRPGLTMSEPNPWTQFFYGGGGMFRTYFPRCSRKTGRKFSLDPPQGFGSQGNYTVPFLLAQPCHGFAPEGGRARTIDLSPRFPRLTLSEKFAFHYLSTTKTNDVVRGGAPCIVVRGYLATSSEPAATCFRPQTRPSTSICSRGLDIVEGSGPPAIFFPSLRRQIPPKRSVWMSPPLPPRLPLGLHAVRYQRFA